MNDVTVNGAPATTSTHAVVGSPGAPRVNSDDI